MAVQDKTLAEGTSWPPLPTNITKPSARAHASYRVPCPASATACRAALAALLSYYTRAVDVAFDVVAERSPLLDGQQSQINGTTKSTFSCNVHLDPGQTRSDIMQSIEDQFAELHKHGQAGLQLHEATGIDLQTVMAMTTTEDEQAGDSLLHRATSEVDIFASHTDRALLLDCRMSNDSLAVIARYDPDVINGVQVDRFLRQLGNLMHQFRDDLLDSPVQSLDAVTKEDLEEIRSWNLEPPAVATDCIQDHISRWAVKTPERVAISGWDGDFTFAELDDLSSRLAVHVHGLELAPESIIPICFEKSKWVVVSMLAVLKAGSAYTLVDPSLPAGRIEAICKQIRPQVALVGDSQRHIMDPVVPRCITVDDGLLQPPLAVEQRSHPSISPQNLAYIIFTSGSTGEPKGSMVEHRGVTSYATTFGPAFKMDSNTRTLQFASYAYAVCMTETWGTLLMGGCVCIPSEHDRVNDIASFIRSNKVNFAILTPSFIGAIRPEDVPCLKVLLLAGEPMKPEMKEMWAERVHLLNAHGQSECLFDGLARIEKDTPDVRLIGRGSGTRLWLIEPGNSDRLVPVGCPGELMMENDAVARGYLNQPELSATKFLTKGPSWYPQGCKPMDSPRFYKSGDLAYYQPDGQIVTLGREDSQVKIRGQRVELGEVEFQLRKITPADASPIVEVVNSSETSGRAMLVAFLVGSSEKSSSGQPTDSGFGASIIDHTTASRFTSEMGKQVGRHAIPSFYISLKKLPNTATGKTDRKKLRTIGAELLEAKGQNAASRSEAARPTSGPEVAMARLWSQSLSVEADSIGTQDDFFDLGGDSIVAIRMVNRARASGMALRVEDILNNPILADMVTATGQDKADPSDQSRDEVPIPVQSRDGNEAELSFSQRGLWFLEQLNPGTPAYHVSIAGRLRGPLQIDALRAALQALEERHETLRTSFKESNGAPVQVIQQCRPAKDTLQLIAMKSNANLDEELQRQQTDAFDLCAAPPWRVALLQLGVEHHVLSIVMHHIISDGWSDEVFRSNLAAFYSAAVAGRDPLKQLEPLPIQYRDFAAWQQHADQEAEQKKQLQYWTEQLTDSAPAELLIDKPRPALPSGLAGVVNTTIDGPLYQSLQRYCKEQRTTPFVVLLAAFRAAHYRLTGAEDATIGSPNAGRNRTELEDLVGFFSNTQCLRIKIEGHTFADLVQQVKATVTAALAHQDVPFERVVSEVLPGSRDASRNPLVQLMFAVHSQSNLGEIDLEGLAGETLQGTASTRFDVEFHLIQKANEIHGNLLFAKELFEPETIEATLQTFKEVLRRGLEEPEVPISSMSLTDGLDMLQKKGMLDTASADYPRDSSIVDVFSAQVKASPQAVAVKDSSTQLTYADLDRQSDSLATWLCRRGLAAETWIGVLASRSCQTIVAFLGILKANLAYVPLDVEAPASRIDGILSAFEEHKLVLVGDEVQIPEIPTEDIDFVRLSDTLNKVDKAEGIPSTTSKQPSATSLAYVMFTSGSTGKPKGVMIEHRGVVRLVKQSNVLSQVPSEIAVAHLFNIAFDLSVWEIYTALLNGGTVVCIDSATKVDPNALEQVFMHEKVQAAMFPPVLLKACLGNAPNTLKGLAAFYNGADRFDSHDAKEARKLVPGRVVNAYGPTENSALSTFYDVSKDDTLTNGVPIGQAISNSGAYVMDANQNLVSVGIMGELVVTGDGVARGYTDPSLDFDRFNEVDINGKRLKAYRTGDRVRWRPTDGQIEFFGRIDRQVKIRGFRIEMGEIEHAMLRQDEVDDAAVVVQQREGEDPDLIGFITTQKQNDDGQEEANSGQVQSWGRQFDNNFYEGIEDIDNSTVGSDFLGWTSMYDGKKIDRSEMQEWLDDSMQTMLDGQPAGRVLEIGTGTGMVLLNLGEGLEYYVGSDPSKPAVTFTSEKVKAIPSLKNKAEIHVGTASDISKIDSQRSDLVVVNSVVQYFPSREYLFDVIEDVSRLSHVKRLFFGDVRSYPLNRYFLASRALYKLGDQASKTDNRREISRMEDREEELLVGPTFFTGLQMQMPDLIEHVEVLPKMMRATNELSSYRYAVVVYFKNRNEESQEVHTVEANSWVDFSARKMDRNALAQLLQDSSNSATVAVSNIPWSKTIMERHIVDALDQEEEQDDSDKAAWLSSARDSAERCPSFSRSDLIELGQQAGFRVEVSWNRQSSQKGGLDAIFHHHSPSWEGSRVKFQFPSDDDSASLSNRPLQGLQNVQVERRVRNAMQAQLPSYMIPRRVTVLETMPTNDNGKVDRKQLAKQAESVSVHKTTASRLPPQNNEERALCEEFSEVLGVDVSPTDDFFGLGGHSLMAMRLLPRISDRLGWHILLRDLYQNSTPRALYGTATSDSNGSQESKWPSYMEVHSRGSKSRATVVLIHGFWGQGRIFAGLAPLLDEHLDIIILHDPFFGKAEGPFTLDEWSNFYLKELSARLPRDGNVILGGYSFGAFTALKMASMWKDWFDVDLTSMLLLDPAVWQPVNMEDMTQEFIDEKVNYGLRLFGEEQRDFVMEHFKKFGPLMASPKGRPDYNGTGLHIASSEVSKMGTTEWYAKNYPNLEQECIDSTHHGLFEWSSATKQVGKAINEHCARIWLEQGLTNGVE